jgi:3-hydroxybutyryl-CoA dehydrogenase
MTAPTGASAAWPARVAVVGAGTMGSGFAEIFGGAGIPSVLADARPEAAEAGRAGACERARSAEERGMWAQGTAERVEANVSAAATLAEAVQAADLVLEAVTEDPGVKAAVYAEIEGAANRDAVIATNTSAIPIKQLASTLASPERFLGVHWFNPPQWVPSVELIPAPATAPDVVERVTAALVALGKRPTVVGDAAGFVGNRIQFAMFKEAVAIVEDGVATPEAVDEVVRNSFGFRLPFFGPFMIADMAGLDVYEGAYRALEEQFGPRFAAPRPITDMVAAGRVGTKVGAGYLDHDPDRVPEIIERRDASYAALSELLKRLSADM